MELIAKLPSKLNFSLNSVFSCRKNGCKMTLKNYKEDDDKYGVDIIKERVKKRRDREHISEC